uniref:Retrotransposon protein, putative, Ty3-gypsy subclass n=1 Tax=Oryza sativa subsp. japonica TaxID=39947 RepID=Q2QR65_ORYSJ|nr:retrotransposon protein, putative, Ty3-gypsy subclass [Oryza sativa Japonica Group]
MTARRHGNGGAATSKVAAQRHDNGGAWRRGRGRGWGDGVGRNGEGWSFIGERRGKEREGEGRRDSGAAARGARWRWDARRRDVDGGGDSGGARLGAGRDGSAARRRQGETTGERRWDGRLGARVFAPSRALPWPHHPSPPSPFSFPRAGRLQPPVPPRLSIGRPCRRVPWLRDAVLVSGLTSSSLEARRSGLLVGVQYLPSSGRLLFLAGEPADVAVSSSGIAEANDEDITVAPDISSGATEAERAVADIETTDDWRTPPIKFLNSDELPEDDAEAEKITRQAKIYCMIGNDLYKKAPNEDYCIGLGVKICFASVSHPQSNGQVERANGIVLQGIKTRVYDRLMSHDKKWVEELPSVLWAVRTTLTTTNKETPFFLVYGSEAMLPTELRHQSTRV